MRITLKSEKKRKDLFKGITTFAQWPVVGWSEITHIVEFWKRSRKKLVKRWRGEIYLWGRFDRNASWDLYHIQGDPLVIETIIAAKGIT